MRTIVFAMALLLSTISYAQSLKNSNPFNARVVANTADAPAIVTITDSIYDSMQLETFGLERHIFFQAYKGYLYLLARNKLKNTGVLTIADYGQSCNNKRLYVLDLVNMQLLFNTYVSHGKNSGGEFATSFSNENESNKSSVGFLVTGEVYYGNYGVSLRLDGMEAGINDHVRERDIVMHGSYFVNDKIIEEKGKIGRSLGCPAIPKADHLAIITSIKNSSCFFIYSQNESYAKQSKIINAKCNWPPVPATDVDAATASTGTKGNNKTQTEAWASEGKN